MSSPLSTQASTQLHLNHLGALENKWGLGPTLETMVQGVWSSVRTPW